MASDDYYPCVVCNKHVRPRQEALQCDNCQRWQHRICKTNIDRQFYRQLVKGVKELVDWFCEECKSPNQELENQENENQKETMSVLSSHSQSDSESDSECSDQECSWYASFHDYPTPEKCCIPDHEDQGLSPCESFQDYTTAPKEINTTQTSYGSFYDYPTPTKQSFYNETYTVEKSDVQNETFSTDNPVVEQYKIVEGGTIRGKSKLIDTINGYSYTVKRSSNGTTFWRCSVRNKTTQCNHENEGFKA